MRPNTVGRSVRPTTSKELFRLASPALLLLFVSPMIGELLSGSAPPAEFFSPVGFVLLVVLYKD
jgi:hypothetical protein